MNGDSSKTMNNRGAFAYSMFIEPTFSRVGMSEEEAKESGKNIKVFSMQAASIPKAKVIRQTDGLLKAIVDTDTNLILGAALFCAESHEIINYLKLAIDNDIEYTKVRDFVFTHPTISEGLNSLFEG